MATSPLMTTPRSPADYPGDSAGGPPRPETPAPAAPMQEDANRQFVNLVRQVHDEIQTLARMRPQMSQHARRALQALTQGMLETVARETPSGSASAPTSSGPTPPSLL